MTDTNPPLYADWNYPTSVRIGPGRISELADTCKSLNMSAPLLITDPMLASLPMVESALDACREGGLNCAVFSDIQANPTGENVAQGVAAFREGNHDGVIAFGGGSGLDAAKTVAVMARQSQSLWELEDVGDNWSSIDASVIAGIVAVPTTAGTGSEVGRAAVIIDSEQQVKKVVFHPKMLPGQVILDPELTVGLPAHITAATGMDALSHSLEAFCAPSYHPMAQGIAIEGMRLVKEYLPRAVAQGDDIEARTHMLVASSMGATAFQKGLGAMHAIAHTLGALYGAHHGLLNAILMPYVLRANRPAIEDEVAGLALYLQLDNPSFDGFLEWTLQLRSDLDIPHTLASIEIDLAQVERVGAMSVVDPTAGSNPILFTEAQYCSIFRAAVEGEL